MWPFMRKTEPVVDKPEKPVVEKWWKVVNVTCPDCERRYSLAIGSEVWTDEILKELKDHCPSCDVEFDVQPNCVIVGLTKSESGEDAMKDVERHTRDVYKFEVVANKVYRIVEKLEKATKDLGDLEDGCVYHATRIRRVEDE